MLMASNSGPVKALTPAVWPGTLRTITRDASTKRSERGKTRDVELIDDDMA